MNTNTLDRRETDVGEVLPIAAGAEMINLFAKGHRSSCEVECRDGKGNVILCRTTEAYMPPLGQNIRRLRLSRNMTQRQLAYHLRVSMQAVSKWERELAYPDMSLLVPIARLFKITLDELFGCE